MMQALFRDMEDDTLFAAEIHRICYVPDNQELYCVSASGDDINIPMPYAVAESIIKDIYDHGKVDLSAWKAYLNREDDDSVEETEEPATNERELPSIDNLSLLNQSAYFAPKVEEKRFGGIFSRRKTHEPWEG